MRGRARDAASDGFDFTAEKLAQHSTGGARNSPAPILCIEIVRIENSRTYNGIEKSASRLVRHMFG